jgi:hypothetical protein
MQNHLLYFYGEECPECIRMKVRISKLEKEEYITFTSYEVWNNKENDELCQKYDTNGDCGGVPFFYNTKTKKSLCGEVTYKELKQWATN